MANTKCWFLCPRQSGLLPPHPASQASDDFADIIQEIRKLPAGDPQRAVLIAQARSLIPIIFAAESPSAIALKIQNFSDDVMRLGSAAYELATLVLVAAGIYFLWRNPIK